MKYVSIDVSLADWMVEALIEDGMFVRRGNQHMRGLYLTDKGSHWLREWCATAIVTGPRRATP